MDNYPFQQIERKWREHWEKHDTFRVDLSDTARKYYVLVMFSYPSEKKLHIGHWWNYGPADTYARFCKMQGRNVFEPMGFDAFGLPAENYAVKHGVHPSETTDDSVSHIREQLKQIGAMYDWSKAVNTSKPDYYKWTQWIFLQLFKTGAAYRKKAPVNWCPDCNTVLANEQVQGDGTCERCDTTVHTRDLEQWFLKITDFADQLLEGLDRIDWPEATKAMQRHWIGRSEGTEITFPLVDHEGGIKTFTTRADTVFGVTYVVLAPEHELVDRITTPENREEVEAYVRSSHDKSDLERQSLEREKTGVFTGAYATNPLNGWTIPVLIADYVLSTYGTGAVMAVPAHDQRDYEFAGKYKLPVITVIRADDPGTEEPEERAFTDHGIMTNSEQFDGLSSEAGKGAVAKWLEERKLGGKAVSYRLRDWLISRQRYWGAPIPVIHCTKCGIVPVPEKDLPVLLPMQIDDFTPKGTSPLGACESFINVSCPRCGESARRDPDTMDTFVDSSWYFLRYLSAQDETGAFDRELQKKWLPVDVYVGGPEHATMHLIYARYITKYLNSIGLLDVDEPFTRLVHQGIITHNGLRMSKSKGNVVNPDEFVDKYGADCFRLYLMFMGDYTVGGDWSDEGIVGIRRFQNRIWRLFEKWADPKYVDSVPKQIDPKVNRAMHVAIKEITRDLGQFQFNTAISRLMELVNEMYRYTNDKSGVDKAFLNETLRRMTILLAPLAPHMSEELWKKLGRQDRAFDQLWLKWDEEAIQLDLITVVVQVNGKLVERLEVGKGLSEQKTLEEAMERVKVQKHTSGRKIQRVVYIPDRILNIVI